MAADAADDRAALAISPPDYDEEWYLKTYPDVAAAVARGDWVSGYAHFSHIGRRNGRLGAPEIDETWYLEEYPEAGREIGTGGARSCSDHYLKFGRYRGYLAEPAERTRTTNSAVRPFFPPGHYHSPVVDPDHGVLSYVARYDDIVPSELLGISIDLTGMRELWRGSLEVIRSCNFNEHRRSLDKRFDLSGPFPYGDALSLLILMHNARPSRIVEIGSGFSTACMLDCGDDLGLADLRITCIEPYPERLLDLLKPEDKKCVELIRQPVQDVPASIVDELSENDFLFIDSTHVLKTGSDVHYELFHLLPRLKPGVFVHFHDCRYPFEYPMEWIKDNYSWNEVYALRAFLSYNSKFSIAFWGSLFRRIFAREIGEEHPTFLVENPGTSLWLRVEH